jgi:tRNA1Val (adenine37-N6)-methyltransferase
MPNNYFQFKQFKIYQGKCSMKVCTDACIFGAWISNEVMRGELKVMSCLDIGTGTGLLSLMIAQKNNFEIDSIEIELNAFEQAKENFKNSPWNERLKIFNADAKKFISTKKYDLIICNPPFFENDLLSGKENSNLAKHNAGLTLSALLSSIKNNISSDGQFAVLLPYYRTKYFEKLVEANQFHLNKKLLIRQTPSHDFFRSILLFSKRNSGTNTSELIIKNSEGNYTDEFINLLKDYYLNL